MQRRNAALGDSHGSMPEIAERAGDTTGAATEAPFVKIARTLRAHLALCTNGLFYDCIGGKLKDALRAAKHTDVCQCIRSAQE
jgi:hypothetical protein